MALAVGVAFAACVWAWLLLDGWRKLKRVHANNAASLTEINRMVDLSTRAVLLKEPPAFVCPFCGKASWNVNDGRYGYCGRCHYWTRDVDLEVLEELEGRGVIPCRERDSNPH